MIEIEGISWVSVVAISLLILSVLLQNSKRMENRNQVDKTANQKNGNQEQNDYDSKNGNNPTIGIHLILLKTKKID
jgi:hypothetical protein